MKERVCLTKKCPLRLKDKETGRIVCLVGQDDKGFFVQPILMVKETDCISRRLGARRVKNE